MKLLFYLTILIWISSTSMAGSDWIGFKPASDANVPKIIQDSAKSVFRIFYPTAPFEIVDLSDTSKLESIIKQYSDKSWETMQLAYCRVQGIEVVPHSVRV